MNDTPNDDKPVPAGPGFESPGLELDEMLRPPESTEGGEEERYGLGRDKSDDSPKRPPVMFKPILRKDPADSGVRMAPVSQRPAGSSRLSTLPPAPIDTMQDDDPTSQLLEVAEILGRDSLGCSVVECAHIARKHIQTRDRERSEVLDVLGFGDDYQGHLAHLVSELKQKAARFDAIQNGDGEQLPESVASASGEGKKKDDTAFWVGLGIAFVVIVILILL